MLEFMDKYFCYKLKQNQFRKGINVMLFIYLTGLIILISGDNVINLILFTLLSVGIIIIALTLTFMIDAIKAIIKLKNKI